MENRIPEYSSREQSMQIAELLPSHKKDQYTIKDIFDLLPEEIELNGRRGYLNLSKNSITYLSYDYEYKSVMIHSSIFYPNKDLFDGFIDMLRFLKHHSII